MAARTVSYGLLGLFDDIETARNGALFFRGRFYAFPEHFTCTSHEAAFKTAAAFAAHGAWDLFTPEQMREAYGRGDVDAVSAEAWEEVLAWFVSEGLLGQVMEPVKVGVYCRTL